MNKQQLLASVQSLIDSNRRHIHMHHNTINDVRKGKRMSDEQDNLEAEYIYHNLLQKLKAELKTSVRNQKALKYVLKELYSAEEF